MNDLEQRVREAFDEVSLPPEVRARTLAAIDDLVQPREASPSKPPAPRIVKWRRAAIALAACLVLAAVDHRFVRNQSECNGQIPLSGHSGSIGHHHFPYSLYDKTVGYRQGINRR